MNWVDGIIILAIILFAVRGYFKGFIRLLSDFLILVIAVIGASRFYGVLGEYITGKYNVPQNISKIIAFVVIWIGVQFILNLVTHLLYPLIPEEVRKSVYNRAAGAIPGFLWGVVLVAVAVTLIAAFPMESKYKDLTTSSRLGAYFLKKTTGFESQIAKLFGGALNDTLTFMTVKTDAEDVIELNFKTTSVRINEEAENKMLELVNRARVANGHKPLVMDAELQVVARAHSRDMFARGYFSHINPEKKSPFDRLTEAGIKFKAAGENIALAPTVEIAHQGLMNSPGHWKNIMDDDYGKIGIGCIDGGKYGLMFSQEFMNK